MKAPHGYQAIAEAFANVPSRELAARARTTVRTADNWKQGLNGPSWLQTAAMLNDPMLRPLILWAADQASGRQLDEIRRLGT